jgi:hypothetical protein
MKNKVKNILIVIFLIINIIIVKSLPAQMNNNTKFNEDTFISNFIFDTITIKDEKILSIQQSDYPYVYEEIKNNLEKIVFIDKDNSIEFHHLDISGSILDNKVEKYNYETIFNDSKNIIILAKNEKITHLIEIDLKNYTLHITFDYNKSPNLHTFNKFIIN